MISPRCSERRDCSSTSYGYFASHTKDAPSDSGWLLMLGELALRALDDYARHRKQGKDPVFVAKRIESLSVTECWYIEEGELPPYSSEPVLEYFEEAVDTEGGAAGMKWPHRTKGRKPERATPSVKRFALPMN